jgi:hypothetical protein
MRLSRIFYVQHYNNAATGFTEKTKPTAILQFFSVNSVASVADGFSGLPFKCATG